MPTVIPYRRTGDNIATLRLSGVDCISPTTDDRQTHRPRVANPRYSDDVPPRACEGAIPHTPSVFRAPPFWQLQAPHTWRVTPRVPWGDGWVLHYLQGFYSVPSLLYLPHAGPNTVAYVIVTYSSGVCCTVCLSPRKTSRKHYRLMTDDGIEPSTNPFQSVSRQAASLALPITRSPLQQFKQSGKAVAPAYARSSLRILAPGQACGLPGAPPCFFMDFACTTA